MTPQDLEPIIPKGYLDLLESEPRPPYSPLSMVDLNNPYRYLEVRGVSTAWSKIRT